MDRCLFHSPAAGHFFFPDHALRHPPFKNGFLFLAYINYNSCISSKGNGSPGTPEKEEKV
jgi:hypothetical protein